MFVCFETIAAHADTGVAYPRFVVEDVWRGVEVAVDRIVGGGSLVQSVVRSDIDGAVHIADIHGNSWTVEYVPQAD